MAKTFGLRDITIFVLSLVRKKKNKESFNLSLVSTENIILVNEAMFYKQTFLVKN